MEEETDQTSQGPEGQKAVQAKETEPIGTPPNPHLKLEHSKPFWKSKRILIPVGIVLLALLLAGVYILFFSKQAEAPQTSEEEQQVIQNVTFRDDPQAVHMLATGDFIAHDAINAEAKTDTGYDYSKMLAPMKEIFDDFNVNFCNQATLAGGEKYGVTGYPSFNAPYEWIHDMKGMNCNVINTGTNHTNDKGQGAITSQLDEWDKQNALAVAGSNRNSEEQNKVRYFEVKGVKFAFVSYSTYSNAPNPNPYSLNRFTPDLYEPQMKEARAQADIVIVSMRWGTEYSEVINSAQDSQAQTLSNLGADIILGHGTHTLQPVKVLTATNGRTTTVWYGLGNFLNAQLETTGLTGCVAQFDIDTATKLITGTSCLPFYQHYEWTAEEKAAEDLLARKNFLIMPLYEATDYLAKSQLNTTVEEQMTRIQGIVNTYTKVSVQNAQDL